MLKYLLVSVLVIIPIISVDSTSVCSDDTKLDMVFVIDSSSSMGRNRFAKVQDAIKNLANKLPMGKDKVQFGFAQYAKKPRKKEVPLDADRSKEDNLKNIDNLNYGSGGRTNLPNGVCLANTFKGRDGVKKVYVVISRGKTNVGKLYKPCKGKKKNYDKDAKEIFQRATENGKNAIVIGLKTKKEGDNDIAIFKKLAEDKNIHQNIDDANLTEALEKAVLDEHCPVPVTPTEPTCEGPKADVVFVIDSSSSMGGEKFAQVQNQILNFAEALPIGPDAIQFGFVQYDKKVRQEVIPLDNTKTKAETISIISGLQFGSGGFTSLPNGLCHANTLTGRDGVKRYYFIVTSGKSNKFKLYDPCKGGEIDDILNTTKQSATVWSVSTATGGPDSSDQAYLDKICLDCAYGVPIDNVWHSLETLGFDILTQK